ncbi:hypothetical protein BOX15_Mlig009152g4 [Macrostomum lignano]|uniref:Uncharacterized protein n=2 Tax=Macrostomum lignano TaxID=282301 RepID=A0A267FL26_9PLAT|nr:hypothetical protein BOX15_Mlig009152g4 [Macrostomum lignano]
MSESDSSSVYNGTTTERNYKSCISDQGELVPHGQLFYPPGFDKCTTCRCSNGEAATCHSVTCSVPAVPCPEGQEPVVTKQDCCSFACFPRGSVWDGGGRGGGKDHGMDGGGGIGTDPSGILTLSVALIAFLLAASFCALLYLLYLNRRRRYELQRALLEQQILQQSATAANAAGDLLLAPTVAASYGPFKPEHSDPPPSYWDIDPPMELASVSAAADDTEQRTRRQVDSDSACSVDCTPDNCSLERDSRCSSSAM